MSLTNIFALNPVEYVESAALAEEACREMIARLEWVNMQPKSIVEVGCKTGVGTSLLSQRYPQAVITGVDNDDNMIAFAKAQVANVNFIHAPADKLPFADQSVDLLVANLTLSFCDNLDDVLQEWQRVLRPEALLMFTCFGPDTLNEWREVLANFTIPHLIDMHHYGDALIKTRFVDPVLDVEFFQLRYRSLQQFHDELIRSGITTKNDLLEKREEQSCIAKYEIVFGHAWAPVATANNVADEFGMVKIPLSQLRRAGVKT